MGVDLPNEGDLPAAGDGIGPLDEGRPAGQTACYQEAENLQPDPSLADPAVAA